MIPQTHLYEKQDLSLPPKINIETLVETKLPPSPGNIMNITTLLRDYNTTTQKIIQAVSYEPVLVARILRLANSPVYALERNVTSIQTAISAIGNFALHDIVMIELASAAFSEGMNNSTLVKKIWQHSLAVALLARELSRILGMRGTEESFTCGLLHDIGKIILLSHDGEGYSEVLENNGEIETLRREVARYGYNHAEVGSLVARRWGLPDEVCYAILHNHNPSQPEHPMLAAHLVDVADIIANLHGFGVRYEEKEKLASSESIMKLGFTEEQMENAWDNIENDLNEVIRTFA